MKCPYRTKSVIEKRDSVWMTIVQEFEDCHMFECPMWDAEIGETGGCKRAEAEIRGISPYSSPLTFKQLLQLL